MVSSSGTRRGRIQRLFCAVKSDAEPFLRVHAGASEPKFPRKGVERAIRFDFTVGELIFSLRAVVLIHKSAAP